MVEPFTMKNLLIFLLIFVVTISMYYFNESERFILVEFKYYIPKLTLSILLIAVSQYILKIRTTLSLIIVTTIITIIFQYLILREQLIFINRWQSLSLSLYDYIFEYRNNFWWILFSVHFGFGYSIYKFLLKSIFNKFIQKSNSDLLDMDE